MDTNLDHFDLLLLRLEPALADPPARYKRLRLKLIKYFQWKRCNDAEMLADETISRIIMKISEGQILQGDKLYSYVYAIAANLYKEYVREEQKKSTLLANIPQFRDPVEFDDCRHLCLRKLSSDKLKLIQEYYLNEKSPQQLAEELNVTLNALRLQIHRIKKELRACYKDCHRQQKYLM